MNNIKSALLISAHMLYMTHNIQERLLLRKNETKISKKLYNLSQSPGQVFIVLGMMTNVYDVSSSTGDLFDRAPLDRGCVF